MNRCTWHLYRSHGLVATAAAVLVELSPCSGGASACPTAGAASVVNVTGTVFTSSPGVQTIVENGPTVAAITFDTCDFVDDGGVCVTIVAASRCSADGFAILACNSLQAWKRTAW